MKNLPNILTLVRIACAGVFAYFFVCHQYNACVITFIISMVSDVLDGAIARKYGCVSDLGKVLDPLADKITLLVVSVCFYTEGWIIWPMLAAVIIKESLMIIGGLIMLRSNVGAYSDRFGKASTVLFCASITMALLEKSPLAAASPYMRPQHRAVLYVHSMLLHSPRPLCAHAVHAPQGIASCRKDAGRLMRAAFSVHQICTSGIV